MTPRLDLNDIANILFENACEDFHKTEKYHLLVEKHNQKVDEYESPVLKKKQLKITLKF